MGIPLQTTYDIHPIETIFFYTQYFPIFLLLDREGEVNLKYI